MSNQKFANEILKHNNIEIQFTEIRFFINDGFRLDTHSKNFMVFTLYHFVWGQS